MGLVMKKISIVIDLEELTDDEVLSLVHILRSMPKKMSKTISDAASDLNITIDQNVKTSASERARKAANARWSKKEQQPKIPKEISSIIHVNETPKEEVIEDTFDCRDILEGNYPGGHAYVR